MASDLEDTNYDDDNEPSEHDEMCWMCHGEGGFHDCGEDYCCCFDKEEITEVCEECGGTGYLI